MKLYRTTAAGRSNVFTGTLKEAHDAAKYAKTEGAADIGIDLIDVPSDKEGVLALLSGETDFEAERSWILTSRGGLAEEK
jgi:hypothetical protein